jgi:hypothetical protein
MIGINKRLLNKDTRPVSYCSELDSEANIERYRVHERS